MVPFEGVRQKGGLHMIRIDLGSGSYALRSLFTGSWRVKNRRFGSKLIASVSGSEGKKHNYGRPGNEGENVGCFGEAGLLVEKRY